MSCECSIIRHRLIIRDHQACILIVIFITFLPPTKEEVNVFTRVRLSVCLSVC